MRVFGCRAKKVRRMCNGVPLYIRLFYYLTLHESRNAQDMSADMRQWLLVSATVVVISVVSFIPLMLFDLSFFLSLMIACLTTIAVIIAFVALMMF